jgi:hypothetical protein
LIQPGCRNHPVRITREGKDLPMSEIALASINTFGKSQLPKANFVQPSEQLITLTYGQLQDLIRNAVTDAILPLKDEVSELKIRLNSQDEKIVALEGMESKDRASFENFKKTHCTFAVRTTNEIDQLFEMVQKKPQPLQNDRADILRALLVANGGKLFAKEARRKMHLSKNRFSELLKICDFIETKPYHLDRRQTIIILKTN